MSFIKLTGDQVIKRLRWVMIGAMLFSMLIALFGQPGDYWRHAEAALRADGLSINDKTNHTFEFFIGQGWLPYLIASVVYCLGAFLPVSVLPRLAALALIFSFIFGHYFGASNWLAVRWHLGVQGPLIYSLALAPVIVLSAFPAAGANAGQIIKRLRWVMVAALLSDMAITLLGQPASYWNHPETVHEANQLSHFFLMQGWYVYLFEQLIYCAAAFWLVSALPRMWGLICVFCFIFGGFNGGSCWLYFQWRPGMEAPIIYGAILSVIIVMLAFSERQDEGQKLNAAPFFQKSVKSNTNR